jgi:AcrR family transcriptional regulator
MPRPAIPGLRERIVGVAGELFYPRGVHDVGMAEIVEKVGCGKNAAYRVFPSKTNLVAAYLAEFASQRDAQIAAALGGLEGQPAAALEAYVAEVVEQSHDPRWTGCALRNYVREARAGDDEASQVARMCLADHRGLVARLVDQLDVDEPRLLADQLWLVIEGVYAGGPEVADAALAVTRRLLHEVG